MGQSLEAVAEEAGAVKHTKPVIIAEIGSNHIGDLDVAKKMISAAAATGVDVVKFQSWRADKLIRTYPDYQKMFDWYKKTELSDERHRELMNICRDEGVGFLTTVFDLDRVDFLASLGMARIKIASPDCGSTKLIEAVKGRFPHVLISTGMALDEEVVAAAGLLKGTSFTMMHCVSLYPTPLDLVGLSRMDWLKTLCDSVGFSDHSKGFEASVFAMARGARFIEKHLTIDHDLPGPDQKMACLPDVFQELARWRDRIWECEGDAHRALSDTEIALREKYIGKWGDNR